MGEPLFLCLQEPASFDVLRMGSARVALKFGVFGQKLLLGCKAERLICAHGQGGRHQTPDPNPCLKLFPTSQGAAPHPPPITTAAIGVIKTIFKLFYLISLAKSLSQAPKPPLAVAGVSAGWGHRPAPCWVTQSIPVTGSTSMP